MDSQAFQRIRAQLSTELRADHPDAARRMLRARSALDVARIMDVVRPPPPRARGLTLAAALERIAAANVRARADAANDAER